MGEAHSGGRTCGRLGAAGMAVSLALTGCSSSSAPHPSHVTSQGPTPIAPAHAQDSDPTTPATPTDFSPAAQLSALRTADAAVTAFAHPESPARRWLAALAPFLTLSAALAYQTVEPARIPAHRVIGSGSIDPSSTGTIARVLVSTDAGPYEVVLQRQTDGAWLAQTITRVAR